MEKCNFCKKETEEPIWYGLTFDKLKFSFCSNKCFLKWYNGIRNKMEEMLDKFKKGIISKKEMMKYIAKNPILDVEVDLSDQPIEKLLSD